MHFRLNFRFKIQYLSTTSANNLNLYRKNFRINHPLLKSLPLKCEEFKSECGKFYFRPSATTRVSNLGVQVTFQNKLKRISIEVKFSLPNYLTPRKSKCKQGLHPPHNILANVFLGWLLALAKPAS